MAKRDRSSSLLCVALGAAVGCTAIIEGELEPPPVIAPAAHGSRPSRGGAAGASSGGGDASAPHGASGGPSSDASDGGAASDPVVADAGGAATLGNYGAGAGGEPLGSGGVTTGGAEHAGAGDVTAGEPASGGAGAGGDGGSGGVQSGGTTLEVITWQGPLPVGDPAKGHLLVIADKCAGCHAEDLGGRGFYRNITPDFETGIGSWTDRQIANAIRGGGGPGTQFCSVMPLYSGLKDRQIADMVAYLRTVPAISNEITAMCPGHYPPGG